MASAISGKLVGGKIVYNAAQVRQILMSELSDGDDSQDDVEVSDDEPSSDDGEVDVLESHSEASSDSECEDSAEVEVDTGPTNRSKKIAKKLGMKILTDKLAPIRYVFELWVKSFQDCYIPNENVTVHEQLVTFRDRCPFRQFIPSKPGKYGIKIWALCDSVTSYVYNMQVYTGREEGQNPEVNQGQPVVLDLISKLEKSGKKCCL